MTNSPNPFEIDQSALPPGGVIDAAWVDSLRQTPAEQRQLPEPTAADSPFAYSPDNALPAGGVIDGQTFAQTPNTVQPATVETAAVSFDTQQRRSRFFRFAQSLVDKQDGKYHFAARLKRSVGEQLLSLEDREFRNQFHTMLGGNVLMLTGVALIEQPGAVSKTTGVVMGNLGILAQGMSVPKMMNRYQELHQQGALGSSAAKQEA